MSLFSRIKNKVRKKLDAFSGEYSDAAPETTIPYDRPDENSASHNTEVVMARLNRPAAAGQSDKQRSAAPKSKSDDSTSPEKPQDE